MEWVKTTAKTVPQAIEQALDTLGVDESEAEIVVVEEPRTGLFGRVKGAARVEARIKPVAVRPKADRRNRRGDRKGRGRGNGRGRGSKGGDKNRSNAKRNSNSGNGNSGSGNRSNRNGSGKQSGQKSNKQSGNADQSKNRSKSGGNKSGDRSKDTAKVKGAAAEGSAQASGDNGGRNSSGRSRNRRRRGGGGGGSDTRTAVAEGAVGSAAGVSAASSVQSAQTVVSAEGGTNRAANGAANKADGDSAKSQQSQRKNPKRSKADSKPMEDKPVEYVDEAVVADHLKGFLGGLTEAFGLPGDVEIERPEPEVMVAQVAGQHGLMVGPKGRTLDAIQELARVSAQRSAPSSVRIRVDVGGYRQQRSEAIAAFAVKAADKAVDNGVEVKLDPMPASDRKAVHDALTEDARVETRSIGNDPRRRVLIVPVVDANESDDGAEEE